MPRIDGINPLLVYDDLQAAHDFLVEAFGFTSGGVERADDQRVVHAEVRAGDTTVWLHRAAAEHGLEPPRSQASATGGLGVRVDDVDAHYARARAAGASIDGEPQDMPYGLREYGARDPEGHRWWFSSPVKRAAEAKTGG